MRIKFFILLAMMVGYTHYLRSFSNLIMQQVGAMQQQYSVATAAAADGSQTGLASNRLVQTEPGW